MTYDWGDGGHNNLIQTITIIFPLVLPDQRLKVTGEDVQRHFIERSSLLGLRPDIIDDEVNLLQPGNDYHRVSKAQHRCLTNDSRSASSSTFFRSLMSSCSKNFLRSSSARASRARPSKSPLHASAMRRRLCRTSGKRVASEVGVHEAIDTSARDATSRG